MIRNVVELNIYSIACHNIGDDYPSRKEIPLYYARIEVGRHLATKHLTILNAVRQPCAHTRLRPRRSTVLQHTIEVHISSICSIFTSVKQMRLTQEYNSPAK